MNVRPAAITAVLVVAAVIITVVIVGTVRTCPFITVTETTTDHITASITGQSAGAEIHVFFDNGSPVAGVQVSGTNVGQAGYFDISPVTTDSNGYVRLAGATGIYVLTLAYQENSYLVLVPWGPFTTTKVTLHIPSGLLSPYEFA